MDSMEPKSQDLIATLRTLGASFRECWQALITAGLSPGESLVQVHRTYEDPFTTVEFIHELLSEVITLDDIQELNWVLDSLVACEIHPISIRIQGRSKTSKTWHWAVKNWLKSPAWERPDPLGQVVDPGAVVRRRNENPMARSADLSSSTLSLVLPYPALLRNCTFGPTLPPLYATAVIFRGGKGLHGVSVLEFPRDGREVRIEFNEMPDLETLPEGLHVPGALVLNGCPKFRLPRLLLVQDLALVNLPSVRNLPQLEKPLFRLLLEGCPVATFPDSAEESDPKMPSDSNWEAREMELRHLPELRDLKLNSKRFPMRAWTYRKKLWVTDCLLLERIQMLGSVAKLGLEDLPNLHTAECAVENTLVARNCPKLKVLPKGKGLTKVKLVNLPLVQEINYTITNRGEFWVENCQGLSTLRIRSQDRLDAIHLENLPLSVVQLPRRPPLRLTLKDVDLTALPNPLAARDELWLIQCHGAEIPSHLKADKLFFQDLPELRALPSQMKCISIQIEACPKLRFEAGSTVQSFLGLEKMDLGQLADGMCVKRCLTLYQCTGSRLPSGLQVKETLYLEDLPDLEVWPADLQAKAVEVVRCPKLPLPNPESRWTVHQKTDGTVVFEMQPKAAYRILWNPLPTS